jgi:Concanavalin A-like lectin/glucanases superfamily
MSHWVLLVAPLVLASFVMLFAFVGCGLEKSGTLADEPQSTDPPKYESVIAKERGIVSHWRLGEKTGDPTAADAVGGNDGKYQGEVTLGEPGALASNADTAVRLNGVDHHITTSFNPFQTGVDRTFEGWANRNSNTNAHALFAGDDPTSYPVLRCNAGSDDVRFNPDASGAGQDFVGALPGTGKWFHWVLVWNSAAKAAELFVDGVSKGKLTYAFEFGGSPGNIELGAEGGATNPFDGHLDEVAVYDAALDSERINFHFVLGSTGAPPT